MHHERFVTAIHSVKRELVGSQSLCLYVLDKLFSNVFHVGKLLLAQRAISVALAQIVRSDRQEHKVEAVTGSGKDDDAGVA